MNAATPTTRSGGTRTPSIPSQRNVLVQRAASILSRVERSCEPGGPAAWFSPESARGAFGIETIRRAAPIAFSDQSHASDSRSLIVRT
jgi:hypothetical protein